MTNQLTNRGNSRLESIADRWRSTGRAFKTLLVLFVAVALTIPGQLVIGSEDRSTVVSVGQVSAFDVTGSAERPELQVAHDSAVSTPSDTLFHVDGNAALVEIPGDLPAGFAGLGDTGDTLFQLPGSASAVLPALGWSTERLSLSQDHDAAEPGEPIELADPGVELTVDVEGPGDLRAFIPVNDHSEVVPVIDTAHGSASTFAIPVGSTMYPTWLATESGTYRLSVVATVHLNDGSSHRSPRAEYVISITNPTADLSPADDVTSAPPHSDDVVESDSTSQPDRVENDTAHSDRGPTDAAATEGPVESSPGTTGDPGSDHEGAPDSASGTVSLTPSGTQYRPGQPVELHAELDLADNRSSDDVYYIWETSDSDGSYQAVPSNASTLLTFTAEPQRNGDNVRVSALTGQGEIIAVSDPVTINVVDPPAQQAIVQSCFVDEVGDKTVVNDGHFDFGVQVSGSNLLARVKDDRENPAVWREPDSLGFRLDGNAERTVPSNPAFDFLGQPGTTFWSVGQAQESGVPWLGWNTQHSSARENINGSTRWQITAVDGPGDLFLYQVDAFGDVIELASSNGDWGSTITIGANTHAHANWSFTEPGVYRVTNTHSAQLNSGGTATVNSELTFIVGDCPGATGSPSGPLSAADLLSDDELNDANAGNVTLHPNVTTAGSTIAATVRGVTESAWLIPVFYSPSATQTEWRSANSAGAVSNITVPQLDAGRHKVAFYTVEADLVGWAPLTIETDSNGPNPSGDDNSNGGNGSNSGRTDAQTPTDNNGVSSTGSSGGGQVVSTSALGSPAVVVCEPQPSGNTGDSTAGGDTGSAGSSGSATAGGTRVDDGHFDLGSHVVDGALVARVKDDRSQPPTWVAPESLTFVLGDAARVAVPSSADYSFLGAAGSDVWMVPQTQKAGVPWLGWNTQHESVRSGVRGSVTFRLDSVDGPGELAVFMSDSFGGVGERSFGTISGFGNSFQVPLNVHAHGNWAFTEPGTYTVTITQEATLATGRASSGTARLNFVVGSGGTGNVATQLNSAVLQVLNPVLSRLPQLSSALGRETNPHPTAVPRTSTNPSPSATPPTGSDAEAEDSEDDAAADDTDGSENSKEGGETTNNAIDCLPHTGASEDTIWLASVSAILLALGLGLVVTARRTEQRA